MKSLSRSCLVLFTIFFMSVSYGENSTHELGDGTEIGGGGGRSHFVSGEGSDTGIGSENDTLRENLLFDLGVNAGGYIAGENTGLGGSGTSSGDSPLIVLLVPVLDINSGGDSRGSTIQTMLGNASPLKYERDGPVVSLVLDDGMIISGGEGGGCITSENRLIENGGVGAGGRIIGQNPVRIENGTSGGDNQFQVCFTNIKKIRGVDSGGYKARGGGDGGGGPGTDIGKSTYSIKIFGLRNGGGDGGSDVGGGGFVL